MKKEETKMLYSEKVKGFTAAHPCEELTAGGARYRYILDGKADGYIRTIRSFLSAAGERL